jgi:hypothetical protein
LVERVHEDHRLADVEEIEASDVLDETGTEAATLTPSPMEVIQMSAPVRRRSLPRRVPPNGSSFMPERITKLWVHQQHSQVESDPLIWANQTYIDRPPFLKFEAEPMRAFRSWSAKWYSA